MLLDYEMNYERTGLFIAFMSWDILFMPITWGFLALTLNYFL